MELNAHLMDWRRKLKIAQVHEKEAERLRESAKRSRCKATDSGGAQCTVDIEREPNHEHRIEDL